MMQVLFSLLMILSSLALVFPQAIPITMTCAVAAARFPSINFNGCSQCLGISINISPPVPTTAYCTACTSGYNLYNNYCSVDCAAGQYFSAGNCPACSAMCATCTQLGSCTSCSSATGYPFAYGSSCYQSCPTATFSSSTTTCQACKTYCTSCTSDSDCSACQNLKFLYQNLCIDACPAGTYADMNSHCQPCVSPCSTCTSDSICQSCESGFLLYSSQCLNSCPDGTYTNSLVCSDCPNGCATCSSATICNSCSSQFYPAPDNLCYATCPTKTYGPSNNRCLSCGDGCESCTDSTYCLQCTSGFNMFEYKCYNPCPPGSFELSTGVCTNCIPTCETCSGSKQCDTCATPYVMNSPEDFCAESSPGSSTGCLSIQNCAACKNSATCLYCATNYYLYGNRCYSPCPQGTFAIDYICKNCLSNCAQCSGLTTCQACISNFFLFEGNQCLSSCPVGYYPSSGVCTACPASSNCASCSSSTDCISCKDGFLMSVTSCVTTCPTQTYNINGVCTACSAHCTNCGEGAICTSCDPGWNLFDNVCSDKCPTGMYKDTNGACQDCPVGCYNCTDATTCGACDSGYVFYQNACPSKCPDGLYNATGFCQNCMTGCKSCNSGTICLQCAVDFVYFNKTCLTTCPDGYYNLDGICTNCPIGCTTCTSALLCQSCAYGYNLHMTDVCSLDITEEEIASVKGMAATTETTGTASNVLSSIYGFMNSGDPTAMFMGSLAKMLQYVKYINIEYPAKIKLMFGLQSRMNSTSESIIIKTQKKIEDRSESSTLADNFGYYKLTSSFVSNCLQSLGILAGILVGIGVNYLMLSLISPSSKIHQICKSLMGILKWNLFLLMFCGQVGDIVFFSSFEFQKANFENAFSVLSFVTCIMMNFLSIYVFYKLIQVNMNIQKSRNSRIVMRQEADFLKDAESKWGSCKVFFDSYKNKKFSQQAFMIFFLIRVLSFYLTIAYFSAYPFFQIIMITIVSVLIVTYLVIIRPFKSILNNLNQIVFELIILAFNGCVLILAALETANSDNYKLREKLETILLNINLVAGFVSTAFVVLKAIVVAWDFYKDWKLKKEASNPRKNWRKKRLANRINTQKTNNTSGLTNPDTLITHPDFSSSNIINLDTMTIMNMDQTYDDMSSNNQTYGDMNSNNQTYDMSLNQINAMSSRNQSFDINPSSSQSHSRNRHKNMNNLISYTPSSSSAHQRDHQRGLGSQRNQVENERNRGMNVIDFQSNSQRINKSSSSGSGLRLSSKRIKKRATHFSNVANQIIQDGQVWEKEEKPALNLGNRQPKEYDPNKARIRRIQNQNKSNGIDIIDL